MMAKPREKQIVSVPPEQTPRLVRAFSSIPDYQDRELLISFIEGIAEEQEPEPGMLRDLLVTWH